MEKYQDIILGILFTGLGLVAAWVARSYSGAGGIYPLVLGLCMSVMGLAIAGRAARLKTNIARTLVGAPVNLILAVCAIAVYVALVVPLGFYTASILLLLTLPLLLGFRRPIYLIMMAFIFLAIVWIVFSVVLEKPLPAEIWSSTRMGGN